jgi:hypothetical protein
MDESSLCVKHEIVSLWMMFREEKHYLLFLRTIRPLRYAGIESYSLNMLVSLCEAPTKERERSKPSVCAFIGEVLVLT